MSSAADANGTDATNDLALELEFESPAQREEFEDAAEFMAMTPSEFAIYLFEQHGQQVN